MLDPKLTHAEYVLLLPSAKFGSSSQGGHPLLRSHKVSAAWGPTPSLCALGLNDQ